MSLRFRLLGPLEVDGHTGPLDLGGPRQRAVLAVLLVHANQPLTADQLVESVWGEHPPRQAVATLQAYISNLRRLLEPDRPARGAARYLQTNGAGYQLTVDPATVDSLRFGELVTRAAGLAEPAPARAREVLGEGLDLWRGPALADFRYDQFAQAEITRLEELRVTALELRAGADLALGRSDDLVPELEALVAANPLRERLWGHLMVALYRAGRQAEALRAYRRCEAHLAEELGISPTEALRELELAVLNQDPSLAGEAPAPAAARPADLVGRGAERAALAAVLDQAAAGRGAVVLVDGEAGIGKTRLLEAMAADAAAAGFRTAFARCVEVGGAPPFWPWTQLARQLGPAELSAAAGPAGRHLAALLPSVEAPMPGPPPFAVAEALASALRTLAARHPLLLVIDDLYSADPDSLSLLTLVAAGIGDEPIVVAGSHRGEDRGPAHPLTAALAELARLDWVTRIPLRRFERGEAAALVRRLAGGAVDDGTIATIHARAEGNAFFTIELTRLLLAEHGLSAGRAASIVPATVVEVMGRRLGQLTEDALRVLRAGAVYGREFDLAVVAEVLGLDLESAAEAVDDALRSGLLQETAAATTYRFSHVIVVDCIGRSLGAVRRASFHERIADSLERRHGHDPARWVDIAHHRCEALAIAGPQPAIGALARAGAHAMASTALELAEDLFQRRHDLVVAQPPSAGRDQDEIAALLDLARLWTWLEGYHSARLGRAAHRLGDLVGMAEGGARFDPGRPITSADPVLSALMARFSYDIVSGHLPAAAEVAARLGEMAADHPDPMISLTAGMTTLVLGVHVPRVTDALAAIEQSRAALEILDPGHTGSVLLPLGQQSGWATQHSFAGWLYWLVGDRDRADAELASARQLCDAIGHPFTRVFCVSVEGIVGVMEGSPARVAEAAAWGRAASDDAVTFGLMGTWLGMQAAWADGMGAGDPAAAARHLRTSLAALDAEGAQVVQPFYWAMVAELELRAGRAAAGHQAAAHGIDVAAATGERFWYPELERLAAEALAALDRPAEARAARRRARQAAAAYGLAYLARRTTAGAAS